MKIINWMRMKLQDLIIKYLKKKGNYIFLFFRKNFDPEKYKKPDPYHGFIHEQYIISSDNQIPRKFDEVKKNIKINEDMSSKGGENKRYIYFLIK